MKQSRRVWIEITLVAAIACAALAVRIYQLDAFPPGLYNDEAAYAMDALSVLNGNLRVFYERNNGREPLFIYLLAVVFQLLDATPYAIRLASALVGTATIVTTYGMVRSLFRFAPEENEQHATWYAAWVALFLAFSYWHLALSRVGFRAITLPLVLTIAFAFVWMTWHRLRSPGAVPWIPALLSGFFLGLTFYTYTAGRMTLVLFAATVAGTLFLADRFAINRRRLLFTAGVMTTVALATMLPLLGYFALHPEYFGAHAVEVSVLNTKYSGGNPGAALLASITKTFLIFFTAPDQNLRHNPAQIPVFDPLLGLLLILGFGLTIYHWRRLTTLFVVLWFLIFALPAILSGEGLPHSLRMIGMTPIVYVLPVFALGWIAAHAPARAQRVLRWLPLPLLLVSAFVGVSGYFGAWIPVERFRAAFMTDYADFARSIAGVEEPQTLWLLPLISREDLSDGRLNTVDFFLKDPSAYATLTLDEASVQSELARVAQGKETVNVLRPTELPELYETSWIFNDVKGMLHMLLRRNAAAPPATDQVQGGMPYAQYTLRGETSFELPVTERPLDTTFADTIRLTGLNVGGGNTWPEVAGTIGMPADQPMWAVMRWQALRPITETLKASLVLRDESGNWAGQVDQYITGDRYPDVLGWAESETGSTYHLLEPAAGLEPGHYTLDLRVYDETSGRIYPISAGGTGASLAIAQVAIEPPLAIDSPLEPQTLIDAAAMPADFHVFGFDLPVARAAPGDSLPLTLYARAPVTPTADYRIEITLHNSSGDIVAGRTLEPGGAGYPTSSWRAGEAFRIPASVTIDPASPAGEYVLHLAVKKDGEPLVDRELAGIEIGGRPRVMTAPTVVQPLAATFDETIRLYGIDAAQMRNLRAGETLTFTLVWQPMRNDTRALVRFVQLLDGQGRLATQQDTIPCNGECPASSWLAGEFLVDPVTLNLPPDLAPGDYTLIGGWYDSASQQRLPALDGGGQPLPDNVFSAPIAIQVGN